MAAWRRHRALPDWLRHRGGFPVVACLESGGTVCQLRPCYLHQRGGLVTPRCVLERCARACSTSHWEPCDLVLEWRRELAVALDDLGPMTCPAYAGAPWCIAATEGLGLKATCRLLLTRDDPGVLP